MAGKVYIDIVHLLKRQS